MSVLKVSNDVTAFIRLPLAFRGHTLSVYLECLTSYCRFKPINYFELPDIRARMPCPCVLMTL